ncbi:MAG TPA: hypothetical protein V6D22_17020 [Candidatus Obscuribacterales bacterium]
MFSFGRVFEADRRCKCAFCDGEINKGDELIYEFNCHKRWHPSCARQAPGSNRFAGPKADKEMETKKVEEKPATEEADKPTEKKQEPAPSRPGPSSDEIAQLRESLARTNERVDELARLVEYLETQVKCNMDLLT